MARRPKLKEQHEELLAKIPSGAKFIQVKTEKGELKYRPIEELANTDVIQVNKQGEPVVMKGRPGRPSNVVIAPSNPVVAQLVRDKQASISKDNVLQSLKTGPEDPDVLHQVILALGEEAAGLAFERTEAERNGKETSNISVRRVNTLKAVADTWLKRKDQVMTRGLDMNSPAFKAIMSFLFETFREVLEASGVRSEMIETVFARLAKQMGDEWEVEAKRRMKNVV